VRVRLDLIVVVIGALVVVGLAYVSSAAKGTPPSISSTYDAGPNGYRALYEVLRTAGVPVSRFERVLGVLDPSVRTLVFTGYEEDRSGKPFDEHDSEYLRRFVESGGRLVAIDQQFDGKQDVSPGVGTTVKGAYPSEAIALAGNGYTAGIGRVGGPIVWLFPFKEPQGVPLLANARGVVAMLYRVGRGEVIAISSPALFSNKYLRNTDNLRFIYNAIAGHGNAAFDEYVHGYDDRLTTWAALPVPVRAAVWIVIAMILVALIGANVPFAPPYLPAPPDERTSADYISAIAELMRRSRRRLPDSYEMAEAQANFRQLKEKRA
jgi:hypothetical protein